MGYSTSFAGRFTLTPALTDEQFYILKGYSEDEHEEGYCQWTPTKDRTGLEWDAGEKFYDYEVWINRIVDKYLRPWGVKIDGEVKWSGEDTEDVGVLVATGDKVTGRKMVPPGARVTCPECDHVFRVQDGEAQ
jgi:hypothetical protein